ncbi:hypothetical protein D9M68_957120 [compost metagenome]
MLADQVGDDIGAARASVAHHLKQPARHAIDPVAPLARGKNGFIALVGAQFAGFVQCRAVRMRQIGDQGMQIHAQWSAKALQSAFP